LITDRNGNQVNLLIIKGSLKIGQYWSLRIIGTGGVVLNYKYETIDTK
jgi:hypothetical protein